MPETSSDFILTHGDLTADPPARLNRILSQQQLQIAAAQGQTGPVTFRNSITGPQFLSTTTAIPTNDFELLTFGAAKDLFGPNAQASALASKQFLGQPVQPLPPTPGGGGSTSTIIEASDFCGGAGLSDLCINAAILAAPAAGAAIHCKAGTWAVNNPVLLNKPNIILYGDGSGTVLQVNAANSFPAGVIQITAGNCAVESLLCNGGINTSTEINFSLLFGAMAGDPAHPNLTGNSMVWVSNGAAATWIYNVTIQDSGGYAILLDSRNASLSNVNIAGVLLQNNIAIVYGGTSGGTTYHGVGSWTGGIFALGGGDGVNPYGYNSAVYAETQVNGLNITNCTCQNITGNAIWAGFTYTTQNLHSQFSIQVNQISDTGRDGIEMGDVQNFLVSGNYLHRIGYVAGAPIYYPNQGAVAIDTSGYVFGGQYTGNTILNVNGEGMDLDGMADSDVSGNTITISWNTDPLYTADQVANYGYSPGAAQNITTGIQTNATFDPRGGQRVTISGNTIKNMGNIAISLFNAQNCLVSGNNIWHPGNTALGAAAIGPPVLLACSASTGSPYISPPRFNRNNVVTGNTITYDVGGLQYCIAESDAYGAVTGPNFVYNNTPLGSNLGQFLASAGGRSGGSNTSYTFHSNSASSGSLQPQLSKTVTQREGTGKIAIISAVTQASSGVVTSNNHPFVNGDVIVFQAVQGMVQLNGATATVSAAATNTFTININTSGYGAYTAGGFVTATLTGAQKWYNVNLQTGTGTLAGTLVDSGIFNASMNGMAFSGAFTTAGRSTFGILSDYLYTGKAILDGFVVLGMYNVNTAFYDNEANSMNDSYGLLRYRRTGGVGSGGVAEISISTSGGNRVWTALGGSGSVAGSDTWVQYNKAGAFGADANATWNYTSQLLTITGMAGQAAIATGLGYIQSFEGFYVADAGSGTASRSYQTVHIAAGGVWARSVLATTYVFVGNSSGVPTGTPGDSFPADGNIYYDTGSKTFQGHQNGSWVTLSTGGAVSPAGSTNSVQVNNAGSFGAASGANTFAYNLTTGVLTVGGSGGYVQSTGGFVSTANVWNAFNGAGSGSGAYFAGLEIAPFSSTGGYIDLNAMGYASFPSPIAGLSGFGSTDALLWVSTANGTVTAVTSVGLQTNTFINAAAGFVTASVAANAIQAPSGGLLAQTLGLNVASPSGTNYPAATFYASSGPRGRIFGPVNASANLFVSENLSWSGSVWNADGTGASYAMVQLASVSSGVTFAIYAGLAASNPVSLNTALAINTVGNMAILGTPSVTAGQALTVVGLSGQAAIYAQNGFVQSDQGYLTTSASATAINVPNGSGQFGGGLQVSTAYYMKGLGSAPASPTSGFGGIYWTGSGAIYGAWNGSTFISVNFASSGGVSSVTASGAGISISPTTGAVVVINTGVTSITAGAGMSVSPSTGAVTVTNIGVTSVAGTVNQVIVSAATGPVTFSLPQSINTGASVTFSAMALTSSATNALNVTGGIDCNAIFCASTAFNSISTSGGIQASSAGFYIGSTQVINGSSVFTGDGVNVGANGIVCGAISCSNTAFNSIATAGGVYCTNYYVLSGGSIFTGQTGFLGLTGGIQFTFNGGGGFPVCDFRGGLLTN